MPIFWRVFIRNGCWILSKAFFCIYWEDHMAFILHFVNVVYLVEDFCIYVHQWNRPIIFFSFFFFFSLYLCLNLVSEWWWLYRMCFGVFLPLQFFWNSFIRIGVSSCLNVCRILLWSHLVLDLFFFFFGSFLITVSFSVLEIGLIIFSISSWFILGQLYFSKNFNPTVLHPSCLPAFP